MSTPDDTSFRLLDWVLSAFGGLIMLFLGLVKSKSDGENRALHARIRETNAVIGKHEEIFTRLFDKMDHMSQRSEDRHAEVLTALHNGLNSKQDKS